MLSIKTKGDLTLAQQIKALGLPPAKRKTFHKKIGREVIKQSRARIKEQKSITGEKFKPRAGDKKGKMLKKLARGSNIRAYTGPNKATVTWPNSLTGKIARAQQEGHTETYNAQRMQHERGTPDYSAPASAEQAKALIKAGYRRYKGKYRSGQKKGGSKYTRVSQSWIKENMTMGQAGLILRMFRDEGAQGSPINMASWRFEVPARPFFGLSKKGIKQLGNELINNLLDGATGTR